MHARRWETVTGALAVLLLFFVPFGNALALGLTAAVLLVLMLVLRLFVVREGPQPGWLAAATVIGFAVAIALVWLVRRTGS